MANSDVAMVNGDNVVLTEQQSFANGLSFQGTCINRKTGVVSLFYDDGHGRTNIDMKKALPYLRDNFPEIFEQAGIKLA